MIGPMLVGVTAQKIFHYKLTTESIEDMSVDMRERNAEALGKSLCFSSIVPCIISALIFSMLFCTYASDKRNLQDHE
ncbi:slc47a1, partial [Symbiodinium sp. KB8]